jgi:hypothetical protein
VKALRDVAAEAPQGLHVRVGLDALGHHGEPEVVAEVDRAAHQDRVVVVRGHVHDERPVDLQLVDGKLLQVRHRRVPGAVVVDGQPHAQFVQAGQDVQGQRRVAHHGRLGDLQPQHAGRHPELGEQFPHRVEQRDVEQAAW